MNSLSRLSVEREAAAIPLRLPAILIAGLFAAGAVVAAPIKVDINNTGRSISEGLDPAYTAWSTTTSWFPAGANTISATFGGATVTFTRAGSSGTALSPGYWKEGVQSTTYNVKLTGDGIKVADGDAGAQIEMRISGLSAGPHTLLLYLNSWDNPATNTFAPVDILVGGVQVVDNLPVTARVTANSLAATAYLGLNAVAGQDVVVLVKAETGGAQNIKNVYINAFEIDAPNAKAQANNPSPDNADEHVDADTGSRTLQWGTAVNGAVSHNVYFGTSQSAVTDATTDSPEFKGGQTANTYPVSGLSPHLAYYWRVDEISSTGAITKGGVWTFRPRRLAFPGAEGYGRFARGGRGGVVRHVTNLNDSGPGSLRDAILGDYGPRTVVFDVSGLITLNSDIIIDETRPCITIAGQTAPGKGICIKRQQFAMSGARDIVFRFLRGLVGKESGETQNATGMAGSDHCIMDHASFGWGIDEELSTRGAKHVTFQRSLIAEALNVAGHQNYPAGTAHGYAATISGKIASYHHNLLAHNEGRNWSIGDEFNGSGGTTYSSQMDITNNVVYNWGGRTTDGTGHQINFVNNYYKPGASSTKFVALTADLSNFTGTQGFYFSGNVMPGKFTEANQTAGRTSTGSVSYNIWAAAPFFPSYVTTHTATNAYKQVLSDVGCNLPQIDNRDTRVIGETIAGTYTYTGSVSGKKGLPDTTADVGGWENYGNETRPSGFDTDNDGMPGWWETIKGLNPDSPSGDFSESNADPDGDGYTNLEDYLNWMAAPNHQVQAGASIDIDLHALARGYLATTPVFTFSGQTGGTVTLIGNRYARFTPAANADALGGFAFTVTDSAGDSMTRQIGVRVIAAATPPTVVITATDASAGESGADRQIRFTITRTGDTSAALDVPLVASGTATAGEDYSGFATPLVIPAGEASAELPLLAIPDDSAEGAETVTIALGASAAFTAGSPSSASATIADTPAQDFYANNIPDPTKRAPTDDADGDGVPNLLEYFAGTNPASAAGSPALLAPAPSATPEPGTFKVRFPRALNRPDVAGSLQWSADLQPWRASGQSDGLRTVTFSESVVSAPGVDPETVEVVATITGEGVTPGIFVRLVVQ